MGTVYEAWHRDLEKRVAIKTLHRHYASSREVRARFSPAACEAADTELAARLPERTLIALQPPTRYNHDALSAEHLPRLYDEAIAFFTEVVEGEGHSELAWKLEAVKNERAALST